MPSIIKALSVYSVIKRFALLAVGVFCAYVVLSLAVQLFTMLNSPRIEMREITDFIYTIILYAVILTVVAIVVGTLDKMLKEKYEGLKKQVVGLIVAYEPVDIERLANYVGLSESDLRKCIGDINAEGEVVITISENNQVRLTRIQAPRGEGPEEMKVYLAKLEQLYKEGKISKSVYERLKREYEEKIKSE